VALSVKCWLVALPLSSLGAGRFGFCFLSWFVGPCAVALARRGGGRGFVFVVCLSVRSVCHLGGRGQIRGKS
jgi:hypothetical protein